MYIYTIYAYIILFQEEPRKWKLRGENIKYENVNDET